VKDAIASYQVLIDLFERIGFFLHRLKNYTAVQLTPDLTMFLGKLMAQVLCILALSTKVMKERRISGYIRLIHIAVADYDTEKFMKRLVGRTDVEDALQRLNILTQEENLMTTAATFQVTSQVHETVTEIKEVVRDVGSDTKATRDIAQRVNQNVLTVKEVAYNTADGVDRVRQDVRHVHGSVEGARRRT
jgi:methyl-accepting chemotaxis protein